MAWLYITTGGLLTLWLGREWLEIRVLQREAWNAIRKVVKRRTEEK